MPAIIIIIYNNQPFLAHERLAQATNVNVINAGEKANDISGPPIPNWSLLLLLPIMTINQLFDHYCGIGEVHSTEQAMERKKSVANPRLN